MEFGKFFIVFVVLIGRLCLSKIIIKTMSKPDGFQELEDATINMITTCDAYKDKTIVLCGNFPGNFIKKLSSHRVFSLVSLDETRRFDSRFNYTNFPKNIHKVYVVLIMASSPAELHDAILPLLDSRYYIGSASFLILGWSPENKHAGCYESLQACTILAKANVYDILNTNLICMDRKKRILIFGFNPYKNQAPIPWYLLQHGRFRTGKLFYVYVRAYTKYEGMCENLLFDKTHDLNGWPIDTLQLCPLPYCLNKENKLFFFGKRDRLEYHMFRGFIKHFFTYVNAKERKEWKAIDSDFTYQPFKIMIDSRQLRGMVLGTSYGYPFGPVDKFLISQYRGNKSQLQKLFSVIDGYSWIGLLVVYFITLLFFKYFLRQPLMDGIINLVRLTCNCGIMGLPTQVAQQTYVACLLFFVVTMQGIFTGNLASLLTHNIPVRQVNSISDLIDFEYNVSVSESDVIYFDDPAFKNHLIVRPALGLQACVAAVEANPMLACLTWSGHAMEDAINAGLHIGTDRIAYEYVVIPIPHRWVLENKFNKFLLTSISAGIMMDFNELVEYKRFVESEAEEEYEKPEIIILQNVNFAFSILGIGLTCAFIIFVVEIMFYRFQHRPIKTRVTVLKKR